MDQELFRLISEPQRRRFFFLFKALEFAPLDRALDLAREAEAFATGGLNEGRLDAGFLCPAAHPESAAAPGIEGGSEPTGRVGETRLGLTGEQRDQLMRGLESGATNKELATRFGLTPRQVQGIRMGSARKAPPATATAREEPTRAPQTNPNTPTSVDEVVRYLRQQDDVVVTQGAGVFLVNGRFRMGTAELLARANKIRARQGKAQFELPDREHSAGKRNGLVNGHPLFWNGSDSGHQPAKST